jgi:hypothetical protein
MTKEEDLLVFLFTRAFTFSVVNLHFLAVHGASMIPRMNSFSSSLLHIISIFCFLFASRITWIRNFGFPCHVLIRYPLFRLSCLRLFSRSGEARSLPPAQKLIRSICVVTFPSQCGNFRKLPSNISSLCMSQITHDEAGRLSV